MAHEDRHGRSLREIRNRIAAYQLTPTPITTILEMSIRIDLVPGLGDDANSIRSNVRRALIGEVTHALTQVIPVAGANIQIPFDPTFAGSKHFTSKAGHMDFVKALFMKALTRMLNEAWANQIQAGANKFLHVGTASVQFLLTKPLNYHSVDDDDMEDEDEE
eukprot:c1477_g1_i2.p1 GENE.c1477_g1_i2~~c1477_g1_i2.p1  ORF type:complete len:162 (+),score=39.31 c1477_g1_i2:102-587(+)